MPIYNPAGKYLVKLKFNGVHRKILVDDRLPVSTGGELMCSHSTHREELWVRPPPSPRAAAASAPLHLSPAPPSSAAALPYPGCASSGEHH